MKLLEWMHRKLRENTIEPLKDLSIGSCTCLSSQQWHEEHHDSQVKTDFSSLYGSRHMKLEYCETSFNAQETSTEIPDLFHGFLTIGTLGSSEEPTITDPPTPTFPVSLDDITEKPNNEVTADDLKLINEELEKFIEAESEEEACNGVSRSSYVSAVTLVEAPLFPLQGYLSGSTIELHEMQAAENKDKRVSLGQLFEDRKLEDKVRMEKPESVNIKGKAAGRTINSLVKKVLKKIGNSSSRSTDGNNHAVPKKRLQKVLQMFHKKIYPESSEVPKEWKAIITQEQKNKTANCCESSKSQDDVRKFSHSPDFRERSPHPDIISKWSDDSEGHWIKTDADFLVLEL